MSPKSAVAAADTEIPVDGRAPGRRFDGVGAISGGGGNSRYLIDYPAAARRAVLDVLFRPGFGAALQILKVEIGGDADSTDGAEPSSEHRRGSVDCAAGYEWWLMGEAKARNPAIKLYALAWAAPGWTGGFGRRRTIRYIIRWLQCAQRHHLRIDYISGSQNEQQYRAWWTEALRAALDARGFARTRIVVADRFDPHARWAIATQLAQDPALRRVTSAVGEHDICGYPTAGYRCRSSPVARALGIPLWGSELGGIRGNPGAAPFARAMIRGYRMARLVAYITWPLMSAMPRGLVHEEAGLVSAKAPWSGRFKIRAITYAISMVSWFTAPGWRYVDGASGAFGGDFANGAYTSLRSPNRRDWTTIAETTTTRRRQHARFVVSGGLRARAVHVWRTRPGSTNPKRWMVRRPDVHSVRGRFTYGLRAGFLYTFTTLAPRRKHRVTSPRAGRLGPYVDDPNANPLDDEPVYLAPMDGAFEHARCWDDRSTTCIQQMAPQRPIYWHEHQGYPYAVIGDPGVRNYTVSCQVRLRHRSSSAGVIARFRHRGKGISNFNGYILDLAGDGSWRLLRNTRVSGVAPVASGSIGTPATAAWHRLALTVHGARLQAGIDRRKVASIARASGRRGIAGIEAGAQVRNGEFTGRSWPVVQYRRLALRP